MPHSRCHLGRSLSTTLVRFVTALIRYGMNLHLSADVLESVMPIEESYGKLSMIVNDIYGFDKELRLWNERQKEGGRLVNMVQHMASDTGVSYPAAKRVLWVLCREWELDYQELVAKRVAEEKNCHTEVVSYIKALEYVLGGNEVWSATTSRYHERL